MTIRTDALVRDYLAALENALGDLNPGQRAELLDDLRGHIETERAALPEDSEAGVRQILDRLGSPETVAAAARVEGQQTPEPTGAPQYVQHPQAPRFGQPGPPAAGPSSTDGRRIVLIVLAVVGAVLGLMFLLAVVAALMFVGGETVPAEQTGPDVVVTQSAP
ncbi:hypothetical protein KIH74_27245 [Kineosporia sp. J2-2]|uniref:Uncharacterized protein n=1 Tax=Kineosporia corallincola TaxID=2835133 RepID=A0ABS5TNJ6_9ACTN|nr:hypothetical protein [Kineosporia corallincola]MBT0772670.1 hypothetical protein [Kineosporia corallincola]